MLRWALAAVILVPLTAEAAPPLAIKVARPPAGVPAYAQIAARRLGTSGNGWGLKASIGGEAVDLGGPGPVGRDALMGEADSAAGFGWRGGRAAAILGYGDLQPALERWEPSLGATEIADEINRRKGGVFGLNLVLRTR
ncbi:MAG: hypothetical protein JOY81_07605 [Alphaproteobacteria bacterium]|nr:hypothetical protein [Alphaproteobacteria bacterium]